MLQQGDVTSKTVSFIIKGFVHDLYFHGHKKLKEVEINAYKIQTDNNNLPVRDAKGIPIPDNDVKAQDTTSDDNGAYVIIFNGVPTGVYCVNVPLNLLNSKYDSRSYYLNIADIDTYNQDIDLVDTKKREEIESDPRKVSIHEIFMLE